MDNINKAIKILQALNEGKDIEMLDPEAGVNKWESVNNPQYWSYLTEFCNNVDKYRIAETANYRPFNSADEFLKYSKTHGLGIRWKDAKDVVFFPTQISNDRILFLDNTGGVQKYSFNDLVNCMFEDYTPCGVINNN